MAEEKKVRKVKEKVREGSKKSKKVDDEEKKKAGEKAIEKGKKKTTKEKTVKKKVTPEKPKVEKKKKVEEKPKEEAKEKPKEEPKEEPKEKSIEKIKFFKEKKLSKDEEELIAKRKKKPRFIRQELYKLKRLKDKWRRPRGIDSKKHEGKRGKGKLPGIGYKNPESVRGINPLGYYPVLIHNTDELKNLNPKKEAAIISSSIGRRKRNEIIKYANKLRITILNPRKGEI